MMAGFHTVAGFGPKELRSTNDYYPTPPLVTLALLQRETFPGVVWEPCAGNGDMVRALKIGGYKVASSELYEYDFTPDLSYFNFLHATKVWDDVRSIVTNPPYVNAIDFVKKAIELNVEKHAWLLRFQFVEGIERYPFFQTNPPARVHVFSRRVQVSGRGLTSVRGGMIVYAWWVWDRGFKGHPELRWIEPEAI